MGEGVMDYISKAAYFLSFGLMACGSIAAALFLMWFFLTVTSEVFKLVLVKLKVWKSFILVSRHYWSSRDGAFEWAAKSNWEDARKLLPKLKTYSVNIKEATHD